MGFLTGKTAIITGAGRAVLEDGSCGSIGYGIATSYAKEGANLVITGRNVKKLEAAKEELERLYGIKVLTVQADVNAGADNEAVVNNVVKQAMDTYGRIDVLINNAQASASGVTLADHTTEQFDLAMYSGLYAAFYYMKACYPYLKETKGSVVNFASGAGLFGNYGQCSYAAAKEGIRGLTRVAANEWAKDGINVNVVCPLAWTAQLEQFEKAYPEAFKANVKTPPMGHFGNNELEIGRVCVQLANPDFKYIFKVDYTGENGFGGVSEGLCYAKYTENGEIKYYDSEDSSDYDGEAAVAVIAYKTTESNGYAVEIDLSKIAVDNLSDITYGNNQ